MDASRGVRSLVRILLAATVAGGVSALAVEARATESSHLRADGWAHGNTFGNGKHNHNSFIVNSPSFSHDIQHTRGVNVGGNTLTPDAICTKSHRCKIIQRVAVSFP